MKSGYLNASRAARLLSGPVGTCHCQRSTSTWPEVQQWLLLPALASASVTHSPVTVVGHRQCGVLRRERRGASRAHGACLSLSDSSSSYQLIDPRSPALRSASFSPGADPTWGQGARGLEPPTPWIQWSPPRIFNHE